MTAREYAKANDIEIIGKLTKKVIEKEKYNVLNGEFETEKTIFYIDEAGTEFIGNTKNGWCITTVDGGII